MHHDNQPTQTQCWICGSGNTVLKRGGIDPAQLTPDNFAITDAHYGTTLSIYECGDCGYLFCPDAGDVTGFYQRLEDTEYENTRAQRSLQAQKLLRHVHKVKPGGTLLDVGAGSGILVEAAQQQGYVTSGIEPSSWLVQKAQHLSLDVVEGIFPQAIGEAHYDIITLIDVIEHVHDPKTLLKDMATHLHADGVAVVVTPDVCSLAARLLGRKWWHYRVAHISYFNKRTFRLALEQAGLEPVKWIRPAWFFPLDYLLLRLGHYLPFAGKLAKWKRAQSLTIPLNLYDSWMVIAKRKM